MGTDKSDAQADLSFCRSYCWLGRCGGLLVERRPLKRGWFDPHSGRPVVSLSKIHLPPKKVLVMPMKRWLCPDMTEKLLTGT